MNRTKITKEQKRREPLILCHATLYIMHSLSQTNQEACVQWPDHCQHSELPSYCPHLCDKGTPDPR